MNTANPGSKPTDTEQRILLAAEEEFFDKGFDSARTTAIAEKAGVTHAMLHYYYRSKQNLFDKVISAKTAQMRSVMFGFIDFENRPLAECIERGMRRHFEYLTRNPRLPMFILNELRRPDSKVLKHIESNKGAADELSVRLQDAIDRGAAAGECRHIDALTLILDIISLNIFPFLSAPLLKNLFSCSIFNYESFLNSRIDENVKTILNKLHP